MKTHKTDWRMFHFKKKSSSEPKNPDVTLS